MPADAAGDDCIPSLWAGLTKTILTTRERVFAYKNEAALMKN